ncbi:threonine ammonia-lyase [Caldibacillus thermolactis]|uniref:L-threonine dehydratase catabolic TdcB n=1 Tax=Pallidibacillus thermolactis TaxID=251051 RepID=A0ABT2WIG5_9BACI|nr:threonine ammonia-lyase [Pallidibacillus thermolactis]MCU9595473.1 threonine ammonia-lyase [Pallidibacillus thermolactis]MCU9600832.1 threonine ammonia-lyase [Pallidibacillus thermolactis subsp. kokeshiiformis]MED1672798.1 threonine ammonia-lyase [Pallidibacillus thermolactis subsp. kokeshiiformis]
MCVYHGDYLTSDKINEAYKKLSQFVHQTPVMTSETTNRIVGKKVYFKMENQQKTGAFKIRGALYKMMQLPEKLRRQGVITASAGNHAQGVAYAAKKANVKATIYMPKHTPLNKVNATKAYGADVVLTGENFDEAFQASLKELDSGKVYIHPFDDYDVMAGQGTVAIELLHEINELDTIIVPVGGGGLISGIAVAAKNIKPTIKIIGVQSNLASPIYRSFRNIQLHVPSAISTIAEGIAVQNPGKKTLPIIENYVDDIITVTDGEIACSILYMLERNKTLVEGAGAAAIAALFRYHQHIRSKQCGVIVSGGNIDIQQMTTIQEIAKKHYVQTG